MRSGSHPSEPPPSPVPDWLSRGSRAAPPVRAHRQTGKERISAVTGLVKNLPPDIRELTLVRRGCDGLARSESRMGLRTELRALKRTRNDSAASPAAVAYRGVSRLRSSEVFIIAYFIYVAFVALFLLPGSWPAWILVVLVAVAVVGLSRTDCILRDWTPLAFALIAYREMDLFSVTPHDRHWEKICVSWDRWVLDEIHLRGAIESLGWLLPFYFEMCYLLVYATGAVALAALLLSGRRDQVDRLWLAYLAGTLGTYALFPFFPSDPPRIVFPSADLPNVMTLPRQLNLWIVGGYGIHSSVFPSAHVSSAFSAAWGLHVALPDRPWISRCMAIYGISVAVATVYGRYHYAVDAVAGIAMSIAALLVSRSGKRSRSR